MSRSSRTLSLLLAMTAVAVVGASFAQATTNETVRGGAGVTLVLPPGWAKVAAARDPVEDPRTLLVIGTEGARAVESDCQVSSYRVPAEGAVVVVIGWRNAVGGASYLPLAGLKLRRGTFECFAGRGGVARVMRRDRDFQVNVMVGDKADAATIADALEAARSFTVLARA